MENIIIIGAGGFGREVWWLIERINKQNKIFNILGFIDDFKEVNTEIIDGLKVLSNVNNIGQFEDNTNIVIAIANTKARKEIVQKIKSIKNFKFPNIIDPTAIIDDKLILGEGNVVCAGVVATVDIQINNFNIIDVNTTIGHDAVIKDFITFYPNVNLSGATIVNDGVEIGTGTQIIQGKKIGENSIVGAGSVVIRDIPDNVTAVGVPTRILEK